MITSSINDTAVVEIDVGHDAISAEALAAVLRDRGFRLELLGGHDPYPGLASSTGYTILIRADEVDEARPIIEDHLSPPVPAPADAPRPWRITWWARWEDR